MSFKVKVLNELAYRFDGAFVWKPEKLQHGLNVVVDLGKLIAGINRVPQNGKIVLPNLEIHCGRAESFCLGTSVGDDLTVVVEGDCRVFLDFDNVVAAAVLDVVDVQLVTLLNEKCFRGEMRKL